MKTTKAMFDEFKKEVYRLQEKWNLKFWKIYVDKGATEGALAITEWQIPGYVANVRIADKVHKINDDIHDPKSHARHELIHLIIAPLVNEIVKAKVNNDTTEDIEEEIVNLLDNILPE